MNTENTISEPERGRGLGMVCGGRVKVCFYFMNGAHGEAESLAQALAAQEQYRSYWIFFALDGTGIRVLEKEAWEMLPAAQEKAGHCRILELDGKTYYAEEFCYDGKVYLFGGGHLAQELVPVLHHLDFCCIVLDDREEYVDKALFPDAGQTMLVDFTKLDEILSIRKNDYLVIVTRGHRCDADAEAFALRTGASYIGVVGSRRKTKYVREKLEAQGFTGEQLDSVYAPIGIEIGSETPAEIAISIAAQLIQIRSAKNRKTKRCTSGASYVNIQNEESIIIENENRIHSSDGSYGTFSCRMRYFPIPQILPVRAAPRQRAHLHPALLRKQRAHPAPRAQQTAKYLTIPPSPYLPQRA